MLKKITLIAFALCVVFASCKKEEDSTKNGLEPSLENLVGTWSLQYIRFDNEDFKQKWSITEVSQPNTQIYTFNSNLGYNLKTMSKDGLNTVYENNGTYKILEGMLEAKKIKHINFDNFSQLNNVIDHIDADHLTLYTISGTGGLGITSRAYSYYVKIK